MTEVTAIPTRTVADVLAELDSLIQNAAANAIPVNIPRAFELLVEHAKLSAAPVDLSGVTARLDGIDKLLLEAGIEQAPAAPAPAPAVDPAPAPTAG